MSFSKDINFDSLLEAAIHSSDSKENRALFDVVRKTRERTEKRTSYIKLHGAALSSKLSTQDEHSTELKRIEEKDIQRVYGQFVTDVFQDPYSYEDKVLQHECYREDGTVAACIDFLVQFTLGDHFHTVVDVNKESDDEQANNEAITKFSSSPQIQRYKSIIDNLHRKLNFTEQLRALLTQAMVFGRAAWLIERDPDTNLPVKLKILPAMTLGRVFRHSKTWDMLGVEYLDFPFPESLLKMEDLTYISMRDFHVSPGSWGYGTSLLERVIDISILNRITNQRNLKEICYRAWAGSQLIKLVGNVNQDTMNRIRDQIANGAGNAIVTNQQVDVTSEKFDTDIAGMTEMRDANNKEILRMLQVPQILFDPQIQNRATSQEVMESWNESVLKTYRTWIADIIEQQWIKPLLATIIENETRPQVETETETKTNAATNVGTNLQGAATAQRTISSNSTSRLNIQPVAQGETPLNRVASGEIPIDPETGKPNLDEADFKFKVVFEPLSFDTKDSEINSTINLFNAGIIDQIKALELIGMEDQIPRAQAEIERKQQIQEQQFNLQVAQVKAEAQATPASPTTALGKASANKTSADVKDMRAMMKNFAASEIAENELIEAKKLVYAEIQKTVAKIAESVN